MSENSSDSDSSCGWTVINHEGSDVEMANSVASSDSCELPPECPSECSSLEPEELQVLQTEQGAAVRLGPGLFGTAEVSTEEEKSHEDNVYFGTASDDSDIVTLEPPKLEEETGNQEGDLVAETHSSEDFNMGSSSSSQYAFCPPEAVFSSQPSGDETSSDEGSHQPSPALRRRRARRKVASSSEPEERLPVGQDLEPEPEPEMDLDPEPEPAPRPRGRQLSSGLNTCVLLALVIAVSMGFGHFYGTIQIQKRQQLDRKMPEAGLGGLEDRLPEGLLEQGSFCGSQSSKGNPARCWILTEAEKKALEAQRTSLATENELLRVSLQQEAQAVHSLREELRSLREQIGVLEDRGTRAELVTENQKLKQDLEDEKQKTQRYGHQREALLAEAQALRSELARERGSAQALRMELGQRRASPAQGDPPQDPQEAALLRERLAELERKLSFEQQRSDLWERLYVEAKDQSGKRETDGKRKGSRASHRAKSRPKETFLGTVKETFDAMKNSTKEFVRHHKEKIKQAKEAVKENLKKFSDSVKSTFRHFKDTTKNIFDDKGNKRFEAAKAAAAEKSKPVFRDYSHPPRCKAPAQDQNCRGPPLRAQAERGKDKPAASEDPRASPGSQPCGVGHGCRAEQRVSRKPCAGELSCAQREAASPFGDVNPIRINEFRQLIEGYLLEELDTFHHWRELDQFIDKFFIDGVFAHPEKLFTRFVEDVKDYLKGMQEYHVDRDGAFERLDGYIYHHIFGHTFPPPNGPSRPDKKQRVGDSENSRHRSQEPKRLEPQPGRREGKWPKCGRGPGRHMASLEIELGQLPFDPKY
ncbi:cell cycle progression protein 1 [Ctenodactylus gundi]